MKVHTLYIYIYTCMYIYIYIVMCMCVYIYIWCLPVFFQAPAAYHSASPLQICMSTRHLLKSLCHLSIRESWPVKISVWMAWWQDNHILKYISSYIHILYIHNYIQSQTYSHPAYTCIIHYLIIYAYTQNSTWNKNARLCISYHTPM